MPPSRTPGKEKENTADREDIASLNPAWLRTFIEVYRAGSFGKAAHRLHISQPAVTQQIRGLEQRAGVRLFVRHATGSEPTPAADLLARDAEGPVNALDSVLKRHFGTGDPRRPLRLGAPSDLISDRILPALADMLMDRIQLRTTLALSDTLLSQLVSGELDIAVVRTRPRLKGVSARPLYDEECSLVAAPGIARALPGDLLALEAPQAPQVPQVLEALEALDGHPLVAFAESLPLIDHYWWSVFHTPASRTPEVVLPDHRAVLAAVRASVGITVVPAHLCADDIARGTLVNLLEPAVPPIVTTYLAVREGDIAHPEVSEAHKRLLDQGRTWS
ncbi:LysR family transcriptional regulator [Streptomyces inusitatus]|uniref:LysR family transcriptional regulator n=1 Tax=Streptomyces inusitatus TaxID=68221 RepID=A0A918PVZ5_9ACTN|nr:LysR family transcriptional regulator [Streptomyces inusitatus]GGZ24787.1 LysR family transcriptional regulator [Streptomyces inusitatus]